MCQKRCTKCQKLTTISDFHRDRRSGDGRASRCRFCASEATAKWAAANRARKNATDRAWKARNRVKDRARGDVRRAVAKGDLIKPDWCEKCGYGRPLEGHHLDYRAPLVVIWLCKVCHGKAHSDG